MPATPKNIAEVHEAGSSMNIVTDRKEQFLLLNDITNNIVEYSLRESVSAQGREGRGFDSDPGRKKKKAIFYLVIRKSR
jgi:hypothetical protein